MKKRRDSKGRVLQIGESQEKNGGYVYKYTDLFGNRQTVRSWRLTDSDPTPKGKHPKPSLRRLEADIMAQLAKGIGNDNLTVLELVDRYESTLTGLKHNTVACHKTVHNVLEQDEFSKRQISKVRTYDAKAFLIKLQKIDGKSYSSIHSIRGVLRPAFKMAVENDWIVKNPFDFELVNVIVNDSVRREAISKKDRDRFLEFVKNDKHYRRYYDAIYILFYTGMRISELCGLTVSDIDFVKKTVTVNKQLHRTRDMRLVIESTKTNAGTRVLTVSNDVVEAFRRIVSNRKAPKIEPMVDGTVGFLFLDKYEQPTVALHWEHYFSSIVKKYNKTYRLQMPKVTPHVCRHTYCSIMAKSGMNPKVLQYLMGHSDISVTLNVYTHIKEEDAREEVERLSNKAKGKKVVWQ